MPTVKIILDKGETPEQAEDLLLKAFEAKSNGDMHTEDFSDPAMQDALQRMIQIQEDNYQALIQEVIQALDEEYNKNGNV